MDHEKSSKGGSGFACSRIEVGAWGAQFYVLLSFKNSVRESQRAFWMGILFCAMAVVFVDVFSAAFFLAPGFCKLALRSLRLWGAKWFSKLGKKKTAGGGADRGGAFWFRSVSKSSFTHACTHTRTHTLGAMLCLCV